MRRCLRRISTGLFLVLSFLSSALAQNASVPNRPEVGLVLEDGGALGLAHIGVLQWLEEHRIPVNYVAGTSMGGLVYLDVEDTYRDIRDLDLGPNLSLQNLVSVEIGKDFMLSHGYIKHDSDVKKWAAPEFLEQGAKDLLNER